MNRKGRRLVLCGTKHYNQWSSVWCAYLDVSRQGGPEVVVGYGLGPDGSPHKLQEQETANKIHQQEHKEAGKQATTACIQQCSLLYLINVKTRICLVLLSSKDSNEVWLCNTIRIFLKTCFFLLSTCIGHNSLSCGMLIKLCLLSVGNSFKTGIISVDLRRFSLFNIYISILNRVAKSIEDILRYHKISFDILNMLVTRKYRFSKKKIW